MSKEEKYTRRPDLDKAFEDMHGVRPIVAMSFIDSDKYKVKLDYKGKIAIITEVMKRGLTESILVEIDGNKFNLKSFKEAEDMVSANFKGKK